MFLSNIDWGRDKLPAFLQATFWNIFLIKKIVFWLKFVSGGRINKHWPALSEMMGLHRTGDKPFPELILIMIFGAMWRD